MVVFGEHGALRFDFNFILLQCEIKSLELYLLLLIWVDFEADLEIGNGSLNSEILWLLLSRMNQLTFAANLNVV